MRDDLGFVIFDPTSGASVHGVLERGGVLALRGPGASERADALTAMAAPSKLPRLLQWTRAGEPLRSGYLRELSFLVAGCPAGEVRARLVLEEAALAVIGTT